MIINKKIIYLINIFSLLIIVGLSIKIIELKNRLEMTGDLTPGAINNKKSSNSNQDKFDLYRVFSMPYDCFVNLNEGGKYKATVGLSVGSTKGEQPFVIISDSISNEGYLLGHVDTFATNEGIAYIEKRYFDEGEKKIFGKYIVKFLGEKTHTVLDFELSPTVLQPTKE